MILQGLKTFKGKNGQLYYQLYCTRPVTEFDKTYSEHVAGNMIETLWVNQNQYDSIGEKSIGKELVVQSDFYNGRTHVTNVSVKG